jgi:hypothetical protein
MDGAQLVPAKETDIVLAIAEDPSHTPSVSASPEGAC